MSVLQKFKAILNKRYESEDGEEFMVEVRPGLTEQQIDDLAQRSPSGRIPDEIRELLEFSGGFDFYMYDISFDGIGLFGFEEVFPHSVQIAEDGGGNFWIVDLDKQGNWGSVYFVCHDPAVVVKQSENLEEFLEHIDELGKRGSSSHMSLIIDKRVFSIWEKDHGFIESVSAHNSNDPILKEFASALPGNFAIADLRDAGNGAGFAWGLFGHDISNTVRDETALLWGFEKQTKKKGFLSKLFG